MFLQYKDQLKQQNSVTHLLLQEIMLFYNVSTRSDLTVSHHQTSLYKILCYTTKQWF